MLYRVYVTDALRAMSGSKNERYYDIITASYAEPKTDAEVRADILDVFKKMEGVK